MTSKTADKMKTKLYDSSVKVRVPDLDDRRNYCRRAIETFAYGRRNPFDTHFVVELMPNKGSGKYWLLVASKEMTVFQLLSMAAKMLQIDPKTSISLCIDALSLTNSSNLECYLDKVSKDGILYITYVTIEPF